MTPQDIRDRLAGAFPDAVGDLQEAHDPFAVVPADRLVALCTWLRDTEGVQLDFLQDLTAVDYPEESLFRVVYHLFSYQHRHGIVLKVECDRAAPSVPTVEGVWPGANWFEREVWDLFGVVFEGHSDLRRVMLPDDWEGHPLRKDYPEPDSYHGISHVRFSPIEGFAQLDALKRQAAAAEAEAAAPEAAETSDEPAAAAEPSAS